MERRLGRMVRSMSFGGNFGFSGSGSGHPAIDVYESESEVLVYMDVAGVDPEKLSVVLERERLTVSGEREFPVLDLCCIHQLEIDYGPFQRSINLPTPVDPDRATSVCRHGLLVVRIPKRITRGRVRIPIS